MRSGLTLLEDVPGSGPEVERQGFYRVRLRIWLNKGEPVQWPESWAIQPWMLEDERRTLVQDLRLDRRALFNGLFYGIDGMRVGGTRRLKISPHLAYGEQGIPGVIPPKSVLVVEVTIVQDRAPSPQPP